jgi:transcriptional regulator with XRE-family HTH domain
LNVAERFGINLKRCRRLAGLSQEAAAIRASVHRTEIGLLERGERCPRIDTVLKLAGAVEVDFAELVDGIAWEPGQSHPGNFELTG